MNFVNWRHLVSLFVYCGVAVLVIVNGQSTTDDDIDKDKIGSDTVEALREELKAELKAELRAEFRAELEQVKAELAAMSAKQSQESTCKFNTVSVTLPVCLRFSRCVFTKL